MIHFTAVGTPAPKGSMKAFMPKGARFPVLTDDNRRTRPWASIVKGAALDAVVRSGDGNIIPLPVEPVEIRVIFFLPRPKSLPRKQLFHVKKPDLDKLSRAVKDALTGVVWQDDSQVVDLHAVKRYVGPGEMPRAMFWITTASLGFQVFTEFMPESRVGRAETITGY